MGTIEDRRSIRKFSEQKLPEEVLREILVAGTMAPSPKNRQPWYFTVLQKGEKKNRLIQEIRCILEEKIQKNPGRIDVEMSMETVDVMDHAPVIVFVGYDYGQVEIHNDGVDWPMSALDIEAVELQSIGAAVQNMLLKAQDLGIGSLWCADILYAYDWIKRYFQKPVVSAVCLGYRLEEPERRSRKDLESVCRNWK
ncbi:MAG: nitroreductase family protein [Lachnospiraceae bacterium]|nr:nitroreductase family protein [Lachnospiraceae bacterium]